MSICKVCGGVTGPFAHKVVRTLDMVQAGNFVCDGHHSPQQKHDGKLDEEGDATVHISDPYVYIRQRWVGEPVNLTPAQALSLLAWLQQEKPTLEQLAKEQEQA